MMLFIATLFITALNYAVDRHCSCPINYKRSSIGPALNDAVHKYEVFEDNQKDRENGISPFLSYDGLRAEEEKA